MSIAIWVTIIVIALLLFVAIDLFNNLPVDTSNMTGREQIQIWWKNSWTQHVASFLALFITPFVILLGGIFVAPMEAIDDSRSVPDHRKRFVKTIVVIVEVVLLISLVVGAIVANTDRVDHSESTHIRSTATASPTYAPAPSASKVIVYVTSSGEKYHRRSCQYLYNSCIEIELQKAKQRDYDPCSKCNPPR